MSINQINVSSMKVSLMSRQRPVAPVAAMPLATPGMAMPQTAPPQMAPMGMPVMPQQGIAPFVPQGQPLTTPGFQNTMPTPSMPVNPAVPVGMPTAVSQPVLTGQTSDVPEMADHSIPDSVISDAQLAQYIQQCQNLVPANDKISVSYGIMTREFAFACTQRNSKNRLLKKSLSNDYMRQMTTPVNDDKGNPIFGTTEWDWSLPIIIYMDSGRIGLTDYFGNIHNGQHCMDAWIESIKAIENNAMAWAKGEESKTKGINYAAMGITPEKLQLRFVLVRGIDPEAADFIDRVRGRTVGDVAYRNREEIMGHATYNELVAKGESVVSQEKLNSYQNAEGKDLSTVAKIISHRKWYKGAFVRGGTAGGMKFEPAAFGAAMHEFQGLFDSVHWLFIKIKSDKEFAKSRKWLNVSIPYLMASHYLAKMAFAKPEYVIDQASGLPVTDNSGQARITWVPTADGIRVANDFITLLVTGGDSTVQTQYSDLMKLRDMFHEDAKIASTIDPKSADYRPYFDRGNDGLRCIWNSLGFAFRRYVFHEPIPFNRVKMSNEYPVYGNGDGFDPSLNPIAAPVAPTTGVAAS